MDTLKFKDLDRAAYTANKLLQFLEGLLYYAGKVPDDLDQAKDMLAAIREVCRNMMAHMVDTHDQMMFLGYPAEAFENDCGPGCLSPALEEKDIRYWRLRMKRDAV